MRCTGQALPLMMPVLSEWKSNFEKSGWSSIAMYIVGTPYTAVHFSRSMDIITWMGSNFSRNTIVEPWFTQLITPSTHPKQWKSGTGMHTRSRQVRFWHAPIQKPSFAMLR